jgi:hypothetical protein
MKRFAVTVTFTVQAQNIGSAKAKSDNAIKQLRAKTHVEHVRIQRDLSERT